MIKNSEERMIARVAERYKGKLPLWVNPYQVLICPVADSLHPYAEQIRRKLDDARFYVDVDNRDKSLAKKIFDAQRFQYNYILVVGEREAARGQVSVRQRKECAAGDHVYLSMDDFLDHLRKEAAAFSHHPLPRVRSSYAGVVC